MKQRAVDSFSFQSMTSDGRVKSGFCERGHRSLLWCCEKRSAKHFELNARTRVRLSAMNGCDICCSARSCFVVYPACLSSSVIGNLGCVPAVSMSKHVVDVFVYNVVSSEDVVIIL